ncbi:hypothetical protein X975_22055, partial [Stegodyphus mimosarum]
MIPLQELPRLCSCRKASRSLFFQKLEKKLELRLK